MDRQKLVKGFTLPEMLLSMVLISSMTILFLPRFKPVQTDYYSFFDRYYHTQISAIRNSSEASFESQTAGRIPFNKNGNVRKAMTLYFSSGTKKQTVVIELGAGRLVEK